MSATKRAERRPRRIAADEAHAWARNLRLGNLHAKMVLSMLTLYVDGDGYCWVGIPSLAEDCELSRDTVRRRLAWLEEIGVIRRKPQWIDENGNRNSDGNGRRTTDLIRLLFESDADRIEDLAAGNAPETDVISDTSDPSQQLGSNPAGTPLTLGRPSQSGEGLISEPEPESPPKAPSGGEKEDGRIEESEPEHFGPSWSAWRGHEVMRRDLALFEFRLLTPEQQLHCRTAIPAFNAMQDKFKRDTVINFHLWIRSRGFDEFPATPLPQAGSASSSSIPINTREGKAVVALHAVARVSAFESGGSVRYQLDVTPRVLAFADAGPSSTWLWIEDRQQLAAWSNFLSDHVRLARPQLLRTRGIGADMRSGFYAPWNWPPLKDGTLSPVTGDDAA